MIVVDHYARLFLLFLLFFLVSIFRLLRYCQLLLHYERAALLLDTIGICINSRAELMTGDRFVLLNEEFDMHSEQKISCLVDFVTHIPQNITVVHPANNETIKCITLAFA